MNTKNMYAFAAGIALLSAMCAGVRAEERSVSAMAQLSRTDRLSERLPAAVPTGLEGLRQNIDDNWKEEFVCTNAAGARTVIDIRRRYASHGFYENVRQLVIRDPGLISYFKDNRIKFPQNEKGEIVVDLGNSNSTNIRYTGNGRILESYVYSAEDLNYGYLLEFTLDSFPGMTIGIYQTRPPYTTVIKHIGDISLDNCSEGAVGAER